MDRGAWWVTIHGVTELDVTNDLRGFPGGSEVKASACNAGDLGLIPGSGRSPQGGHGNPLQYSCLENPMDRGAWWVTVHRVAKSWAGLSMPMHAEEFGVERSLLKFEFDGLTWRST